MEIACKATHQRIATICAWSPCGNNYMQTRHCQVIVFAILLAPLAAASPIVSHFYHVKVRLTDGTIHTGNTWGIGWMAGGSFQEQKIKRVDLKSTSDTIAATFHLLEEDVTKTFTSSVKDRHGKPHSLVLYSGYERFGDTGSPAYFWAKNGKELPLTQISSIETVNVIGSGHAVDDPHPYQNVQEPFVVAEDCGPGCAVKLFSRDPAVNKEDLERIGATYLGCTNEMPKAEWIQIMKRRQLVLLKDPFCTN